MRTFSRMRPFVSQRMREALGGVPGAEFETCARLTEPRPVHPHVNLDMRRVWLSNAILPALLDLAPGVLPLLSDIRPALGDAATRQSDAEIPAQTAFLRCVATCAPR